MAEQLQLFDGCYELLLLCDGDGDGMVVEVAESIIIRVVMGSLFNDEEL